MTPQAVSVFSGSSTAPSHISLSVVPASYPWLSMTLVLHSLTVALSSISTKNSAPVTVLILSCTMVVKRQGGGVMVSPFPVS